jgi:hypothetical protein
MTAAGVAVRVCCSSCSSAAGRPNRLKQTITAAPAKEADADAHGTVLRGERQRSGPPGPKRNSAKRLEREALRGSPGPGPVWDGPWGTWTRGKGARSVSWVTVACSGCSTVPRDERRMPAVFATVEDARARLPRDWEWTVTSWPAGPGLALCPACAARVAQLPADRTAARPAVLRQEGKLCPG